MAAPPTFPWTVSRARPASRCRRAPVSPAIHSRQARTPVAARRFLRSLDGTEVESRTVSGIRSDAGSLCPWRIPISRAAPRPAPAPVTHRTVDPVTPPGAARSDGSGRPSLRERFAQLGQAGAGVVLARMGLDRL